MELRPPEVVLYSKEGPVRPSMFLYGQTRYGMVPVWYGMVMVWYGHGMVWSWYGMVGCEIQEFDNERKSQKLK